jgi:[ribosomal protein S5]-alanine N-acetyltransferase
VNTSDIHLETSRLILREFEQDDWQAVHAWESDPETARFMHRDVMDKDGTRNFIRRALACRTATPRKKWHLGITLRTGELIGSIALGMVAEQTAGLGFALHHDHWNLGYATEAVGAVLRFGFETLGLHRVRAHCHVDNTASVRVMEKNGMRREGTHLEHTLKDGQWMDIHVYAILEREWSALNLH